jgi:hypothetical protein
MVDLGCSALGRAISRNLETEGAEESVVTSIQDALSNKPEATLTMRAGSIMQYIRWMASMSMPRCFPIEEVNADEYLMNLKQEKAAATRAGGFLEAWNFCVHKIGFDDPEKVSLSPRCKGLAAQQCLTKKMLKQKSPLTVEMVTRLEMAMCDGLRPGGARLTTAEEAVTGCTLLMLY